MVITPSHVTYLEGYPRGLPRATLLPPYLSTVPVLVHYFTDRFRKQLQFNATDQVSNVRSSTCQAFTVLR